MYVKFAIWFLNLSKFLAEEEKKLRKENIDNDENLRYSKYNQYETLAKQWAYNTERKDGDKKVLYNAQNNTWNELIADKNEDNGYYESQSIKDTPANEEKIHNLLFGVKYDDINEKRRTADRIVKSYETGQRNNSQYNDDAIQDGRENGRASGIHQEQQRGNTSGNPSESKSTKRYALKQSRSQEIFEDIRFSLKDNQPIANSKEISYNKQNGNARYNIKSNYSQYRTTAMIWANETKTRAGDLKVLYNPKTDTFNLLEANGSGDFVVLKQNKNYRIVENLFEELKNEQGSNFEFNESVKEFEESVRRSDNMDLWGVENNEASVTTGRQTERESQNGRVGNSKTNSENNQYELN